MIRLPGWLVFIVFVPLQIWLFIEILQAWGWLAAIGTFLLLGILATRAARAPWMLHAFFPGWAERRERRRHVFQGALFLIAAVTLIFSWGPQPWLPAAAAVSLVKSAVQ